MQHEVHVQLAGARVPAAHCVVARVLGVGYPGWKSPALLGEHQLAAGRGPQQGDDLARFLDEEVAERAAREHDAGHVRRDRDEARHVCDAGARWKGPGHLGDPNYLA